MGLRLQGKVQHGSKPQGPEDAQGVLVKAGLRPAHCADGPLGQVRLPPEEVLQPLAGGVGHGVDGKVPPGGILAQAAGEGDPIWVAGVGVNPVHPVGGDLQRLPLQQDGDGAVAQAGLDTGVGGKDPLGLLRQGGGGEVIVLGGQAQKGIPDAAPHDPGLIPRRLEEGQGFRRPGREGQVHGCPSPLGWKRTCTRVPRPSWLSMWTLASW